MRSFNVEDADAQAADADTLIKLRKPIGVSFDGIPLSDAIGYVRDQLNVDVIVDTRDLEAAGVSPNNPVTLKIARPASGEQVLNWVLRSASSGEARYAIDHGVVLISSRARLSGMTVTRVYDLSGIADGPQAEKVAELVVKFVDPDDSAQNGGQHGSVAAFDNKLVVTQTEPNQREVEKLLTLLKTRSPNHAATEAPAGSRPPLPAPFQPAPVQ